MTAALAWLGVVALHATWLGLGAAAIAAFALRWLGVDRPRRRHALALAALLAVPPAALAVTLVPGLVTAPVAAASATAMVSGPAGPGLGVSLAPATPWIGLVWALGAAWGVLGLVVAGGKLARLRRAARPLAGDLAERLLARARRQLDHRGPVALASSVAVDGPTLLGWRRPLIVVPAAMLHRAEEDGLEWLLVHELAHVRRSDIAWSWLQALVEVALFFHPAARWLSRQVRHERECCCDAAIPARQGDLVAYVRALTHLAGADRVAVGPALSATGGTLVNRVERLVDPTTVTPTCTRGFCLALALGAVAGGLALAACETEEDTASARAIAVEKSAEFVDGHGVATKVPAGGEWTPGQPGDLKYIDSEGREISRVGPDGKPRAFGFFTDEHGQNFAVEMTADWEPAKRAVDEGVPIPFVDPPEGQEPAGQDTGGC